MKYKRFEDLPVWKDAIDFSVKVFDFTVIAEKDFTGLGDLKNQLERAAVSISNNIAEGFERGATSELIQYLYISRGSSGECRSMTYILGKIGRFSKFRSEILTLRSATERINRQLYGWIESLKNSDLKGEKYLNAKSRVSYQRKRDLDEFNEEMKQFREEFKKKLERGEI